MCAGHFPQPVQPLKEPVMSEDDMCYRYYCPRGGLQGPDRNVGPYVPVCNINVFCASEQTCHANPIVNGQLHLARYSVIDC